MKRVQYHRYGGPEVMQLEEFEPPAPRRGEVLVRVAAAAANPLDFAVRRGSMRFLTGRRFPRGLGHDFAGIVAAVGPGVTRFTPGDEVLGGMLPRPSGAYAEMGIAKAKHLVAKSPQLSFEEAATIPTIGVTARQAVIDKGGLEVGQSIFITGCLGGVGRTAVQIALQLGASVGGSCRDTARDEARALGVDPVTGFDFDPATLAGHFDVVVDAANVLSREVALSLLTPHGRYVDVHPTPWKMLRGLFPGRRRVLFGVWRRADLEFLAEAAANGEIAFPVARTEPLSSAIGALTDLEEEGTPKNGRLVITMS